MEKNLVPSDPPGVLRVPILGPNRGMFSKLNGPSPLGSGGHSYTSFSIGRFYAQWNSFGGDVFVQSLKNEFETYDFLLKARFYQKIIRLKIVLATFLAKTVFRRTASQKH